VQYNGFVYCLEVPNHTLLVRRKGKVIWCGNCRHEFIPYYEDIHSDEDNEQLRKQSEIKTDKGGGLSDVREKKEAEAYAKWQAYNRQYNQEAKEYAQMKIALNKDMPYTTLAGYRRAVRKDELPVNLKKYRYKDRDTVQYDRWEEIIGKENMPDTVAKFQDIKYNNKSNDYQNLKNSVEELMEQKKIYEKVDDGGVHSGKLNNFKGYTEKQLEKSIRSYRKTIEKHKNKIDKPQDEISEWDNLSVEEKNRIIKKWNDDIFRNRQECLLAQELLRRLKNGKE
jgi:hypothetical protein